jgi:hypothetical protein
LPLEQEGLEKRAQCDTGWKGRIVVPENFLAAYGSGGRNLNGKNRQRIVRHRALGGQVVSTSFLTVDSTATKAILARPITFVIGRSWQLIIGICLLWRAAGVGASA